MTRMEPADARMYWMSRAIPNDQFLLYCFADHHISIDDRAAGLCRRAAGVPDLTIRVLDIPAGLDHPQWVHRPVGADQIVLHRSVTTWRDCLDSVAALTADQLTPTSAAWRIHLFPAVPDTPRGAGVVVVIQVSHALGDGRRASAIARRLFSGPAGIPASDDVRGRKIDSEFDGDGRPGIERRALVIAASGAATLPLRIAGMLWRGLDAYRTVLARPPTEGTGYVVTGLNRPPGTERLLRVLTRERTDFPAAHSVTVGALTAISVALHAELDAHAERLGVELTMGRRRPSRSRNNFRNVGIDLHTEIDDLDARASAIAAEIDRARQADDEPARLAERRATDAVPAPLVRWGIDRFDPHRRPDRVTGVTVVSSVYRGAADLDLDGGPVLFTAGFPALSPAQGLTHGVHGIGSTIALSVTTAPTILADVDQYVARLESAIDAVAAACAQDSSGPPGRE
ncbi:WS/DGAT domain-containing protein [Gordonia sp. ABSL11-1]|uniref:WS/DGAT domain-containing protein n=1 Tax=Gordonia sp. ABSL11-1 TaxID=3053924 RepID=UPI002573CA13|nr:WS/DGAT domain-containing protein [Gordonia sp. ABSL11-1]MDL9943994.1 WS/DGAT domain-containing protein [Gordonia sp. ABSL11-1]